MVVFLALGCATAAATILSWLELLRPGDGKAVFPRLLSSSEIPVMLHRLLRRGLTSYCQSRQEILAVRELILRVLLAHSDVALPADVCAPRAGLICGANITSNFVAVACFTRDSSSFLRHASLR